MVIDQPAISHLNCICYESGRYEECIRDCEIALALNGKFSKGYARLAKSYLALGNYQRARESYEKAMEVAPTDKQLVEDSKRCNVVFYHLYHSLYN
jgi:tetratricopeptide (TPR) repeat protein